MASTPRKDLKPPILIGRADLGTLQGLLGRATAASSATELLDDELSRAEVADQDQLHHICRIGSQVTYEDTDTGLTRTIQLVLPGEADIDLGRVSVLSYVGAALIGLGAGTEFAWSDGSDRRHHIRVLAVDNSGIGSDTKAGAKR